ncbi:major facilitator superfamily domain-containing protein 6 [Phlebotomus argentipes]|uniref:major facilitator superfamily domain-containing protein 6 n=1 Tax=Phlebotomus argentipes TaxID=94469 RepID=UPI002892C6D9|nr:major facilitator superfamily domain-containing protein 6 [Phlebotomus argentipes]XP_059622544.1 major facilitator superfamily domain-containing protein 6 [Phlebotomus argentipes]
MQQMNDEYGDEYADHGQQRPPPAHYQAARPMVDPEAEGEVDPNLYPQAKESTHKIRGRYDMIEMLCGSVDQELLFVKTFYFFFYSAFGSLFPLMGVYFKQMGMNPGQCGLLIGIRPFVEFLSAPFWGSYADRCKKGKTLLMASLSCWILFTLPLGFIQPPATSCLEKHNDTDYELKIPQVPRILKRSIPHETLTELEDSFGRLADGTRKFERVTRSVRPISEAGQSPLDVRYASNYNAKLHGSWVSPLFSSIVYRTEDIQKAFFLLILLVIIGEFFAAPAITLADSAVITILGDQSDRYGHQRMFGSLGWGLAMFFVGIALDHSTAFPDHPCGPEKEEKNYTICFATFSVLMGAALLTATQITFKYDYEEPAPVEPQGEAKPSYEDEMQNQLAAQLQLPSLAAPTKPSSGSLLTSDMGAQTKMFAQTTREMPEWMTVLKQFKNLKCGSFLFVAWFMGFGIGLIFTFLFWHLQDYGGSPTLFGVASVINHISEIFAYFFSFRLITQIGHVKVLCLGLVGNILRFLYISYLKNPWWVLPFEFMQGITHAAVWAACCSYISHNTPQHLRGSAQGVLQGLHHGLGRGCGAVIGGIFVTCFGTTATFRGYGISCIFVLAAFIFVNFYRKEGGFVSDIPMTEDPRQVAEDTAHLAPHGVPSNPIPRALSSTRLNEVHSNDNYGTSYQAGGSNLDVPGGSPRNPFQQ